MLCASVVFVKWARALSQQQQQRWKQWKNKNGRFFRGETPAATISRWIERPREWKSRNTKRRFSIFFFNDHCFDFFGAKPQINSLTDYNIPSVHAVPLRGLLFGSWLGFGLWRKSSQMVCRRLYNLMCLGGGSSLYYANGKLRVAQVFKLYSSKALTHTWETLVFNIQATANNNNDNNNNK